MNVFIWEVTYHFHMESFVCGFLLSYFIMLIVHEFDVDMAKLRAQRNVQCQSE